MAIVLDNKAHKQQRTMMTEDKSRTRLSKSIYLVFGLAAALAVSFLYDATIFTVDLTNSILYQSEPDFAAPTVIHSNSIVLSTTNNQDTYNITTQSSPPIKLRQSTLPDTTNNNTSTPQPFLAQGTVCSLRPGGTIV